jgi:hypothetical protein
VAYPANGAPPISARHSIVATVDDGLRHRVLDLESRGKSSTVPERIRSFLRQHWPEGAAFPLHTVTVTTLEEYRDRRLAACQPNTVIRELRELRAMLKKARDGFVVPNALFPRENLTRVRMLTPAQYETIFPHLREHHGAIFADLSELALLGSCGRPMSVCSTLVGYDPPAGQCGSLASRKSSAGPPDAEGFRSADAWAGSQRMLSLPHAMSAPFWGT